MKTSHVLSVLAVAALPVFAGPPMVQTSKTTVAPAPPIYGAGPYVAFQAGVNAHQNIVDDADRDFDNIRFSFEDNSDVGFFVGAKAGYVFGTGMIRPTVELDAFYNRFDADVDVKSDLGGDGASLGGDVDSGAFLANFLIRFDFGRFQPYVGAGLGVHITELSDPTVTIDGVTFEGDGGSTTDFAWQIVAGADYYLNEDLSIFLEYKYLTYEGTGSSAGIIEDSIDQHLVGLGLRWHF
jgi:opacity protein-like surface antigen